MTDVEGMDLETAPETASYRQHRRLVWQVIRSRYADALADAALRGLTDGARKTAAQTVRGDIRSLMSELLTRAPVAAIMQFLAVGREWGEAGEDLLDQSNAVIELVEAAYPRPTWTALEFLDPQATEDNARWASWTHSWADALRATSPAARDVIAPAPAKPVISNSTEKPPALRGWAPWLMSAMAILGATTAIVVATKE